MKNWNYNKFANFLKSIIKFYNKIKLYNKSNKYRKNYQIKIVKICKIIVF